MNKKYTFAKPRVQFLKKYNVFVVDWFTKDGHYYVVTEPVAEDKQ